MHLKPQLDTLFLITFGELRLACDPLGHVHHGIANDYLLVHLSDTLGDIAGIRHILQKLVGNESGDRQIEIFKLILISRHIQQGIRKLLKEVGKLLSEVFLRIKKRIELLIEHVAVYGRKPSYLLEIVPESLAVVIRTVELFYIR